MHLGAPVPQVSPTVARQDLNVDAHRQRLAQLARLVAKDRSIDRSDLLRRQGLVVVLGLLHARASRLPTPEPGPRNQKPRISFLEPLLPRFVDKLELHVGCDAVVPVRGFERRQIVAFVVSGRKVASLVRVRRRIVLVHLWRCRERLVGVDVALVGRGRRGERGTRDVEPAGPDAPLEV